MTLKTYQQLRLTITAVIAIIFSQSLIFRNFFVPVITVILAWIGLTFLRRQVKEVIADERDYQVSGQSAMWAMQIYSWVSVIIMFVLYATRDLNPGFEPVAVTLAYSTCFLMLVYSLIFKFHDRLLLTKKKALLYFLIAVIIGVVAVFTLRLFSGEDNWICQNGQWVAHGQPNFPAPTTICQ